MQDKKSSFWDLGDSFTKLTPEYVAGIIGGFGLGLVVAALQFGWTFPLGFLLVTIGSILGKIASEKDSRQSHLDLHPNSPDGSRVSSGVFRFGHRNNRKRSPNIGSKLIRVGTHCGDALRREECGGRRENEIRPVPLIGYNAEQSESYPLHGKRYDKSHAEIPLVKVQLADDICRHHAVCDLVQLAGVHGSNEDLFAAFGG